MSEAENIDKIEDDKILKISLNMSSDLVKKLDTEAKNLGSLTRSGLVRFILIKYFEKIN